MPLTQQDLAQLTATLGQDGLSPNAVNLLDAPGSGLPNSALLLSASQAEVLACAPFNTTPTGAAGTLVGVVSFRREWSSGPDQQSPIGVGTYVVRTTANQTITLVNDQTSHVLGAAAPQPLTQPSANKALLARDRCAFRTDGTQWTIGVGPDQLLTSAEKQTISDEVLTAVNELRNARRIDAAEAVNLGEALHGYLDKAEFVVVPAVEPPTDAPGRLVGILKVLSVDPLQLSAPSGGGSLSVQTGSYAVRIDSPAGVRLEPASGGAAQVVQRENVEPIAETGGPVMAVGCISFLGIRISCG